MTRRGTRFYWIGAFAPGTVGGRRAHPPKSEKDLTKKINVKERRKAIRSAIAATIVKTLVEKRGHNVPQEYPFIIESKLETLNTTKSTLKALLNLGLEDELGLVSVKKKRAGKGKMRNRRTSQKIGPLIVVAHDCALMKSAANIPGVEVKRVDLLNANILAPGNDIGRLTIFTEAAIERLTQEKLFMNDYKAPKQEAPVQEKISVQKKTDKKGSKTANKTKIPPEKKSDIKKK